MLTDVYGDVTLPKPSIQLTGWFSDLPHGRADEVTLRESTGRVSEHDAATVADYLEAGAVVGETTGAVLRDVLDPDQPEIGPFAIQSDGEFAWPSDYPHYVRAYGVAVPRDLVRRASGGTAPALGPDEIDEVVDALYG